MKKLMLPIVLCTSAAVLAAQPAQDAAQPPQEQAKIVQAALVLPSGAQAMRAPAASPAQAARAQGPSSEAAEGERPSTLMLLAALALMVGIALRRWSMGPQ